MLVAGKYDAVYARRLIHQPTPEAAKAIEAFAEKVVLEFATALADDANQIRRDNKQCSAVSKHCTHSDEEVRFLTIP